jgi:endonuclease/exonuclease/phosphatase family metal-dependent hydrolase
VDGAATSVVSTRVRLVTANLALDGGADPAAFARLVEDLAADVVAVQELGWAQAAALAAVLPFGRLEPGRAGGRLGIARRSPGRVTRVPLPSRDGYATDLGLVRRDGREELVEIINVHIVAPHLSPPWRTFSRRRAQLRALDSHLKTVPNQARVLVGDLNATPLWPVYRTLTRRLRDAALEASRDNGSRPAPTWGPWPGAPRLLRIDHALVSGLAVHAVRVVPVAGSDHSALVVDLSLPEL